MQFPISWVELTRELNRPKKINIVCTKHVKIVSIIQTDSMIKIILLTTTDWWNIEVIAVVAMFMKGRKWDFSVRLSKEIATMSITRQMRYDCKKLGNNFVPQRSTLKIELVVRKAAQTSFLPGST